MFQAVNSSRHSEKPHQVRDENSSGDLPRIVINLKVGMLGEIKLKRKILWRNILNENSNRDYGTRCEFK